MKELINIQQNLKAPKGQFNKFGNYNYRNCEDILEAVKPFLEGCILVLNDELVNIGERYYVKATATLTCGTKSISTTAYAREAVSKKGMDESQITGAASSYARKYALNGLFLIDDTKDADSQNNSHSEQNTPKNTTNKKEMDVTPVLKAISEFTTANDLKNYWISLDKDAKCIPAVIEAKDKQKGIVK